MVRLIQILGDWMSIRLIFLMMTMIESGVALDWFAFQRHPNLRCLLQTSVAPHHWLVIATMRAKASCLLLWLWMRCNSRFRFLRIGCCQSFFFVGDACFLVSFYGRLADTLAKTIFPTNDVCCRGILSAITCCPIIKGRLAGGREDVSSPESRKNLWPASCLTASTCLSTGRLLLGALPHVFVIPMQSFQF